MDDTELATIQAWQKGDEQAVHTIFNSYYPRAVRLAALSGLASEEAQDCAQEAFLLAFERRAQLRDPAAFPLWFHRIITHRILDTLEARQRTRKVSLEALQEIRENWEGNRAAQPEELAISAERSQQLWQSVQQLPAQYRVPLVLRYYGNFSLAEVAALIGKREGTIRVTIHRALQQLRLLTKEHAIAEEVPLPHELSLS